MENSPKDYNKEFIKYYGLESNEINILELNEKKAKFKDRDVTSKYYFYPLLSGFCAAAYNIYDLKKNKRYNPKGAYTQLSITFVFLLSFQITRYSIRRFDYLDLKD